MSKPLRSVSKTKSVSKPNGSISGSQFAYSLRNRAITSALSELLKAREYAIDNGCDKWDFAVEIGTLRQFGTTDTDLRWLILKELLEHRHDTSGPNDEGRCFEFANPLKFQSHSCFVLTRAGSAFVSKLLSELDSSATLLPLIFAEPNRAEVPTPFWDPMRRQLRVFDFVVKHFRWAARNQELVLSAFQEERWPSEIDDPLIPIVGLQSKERLHDTIKGLNRNQKIRLIQFRGNGTGEGVLWNFTPKGLKEIGTDLPRVGNDLD